MICNFLTLSEESESVDILQNIWHGPKGDVLTHNTTSYDLKSLSTFCTTKLSIIQYSKLHSHQVYVFPDLHLDGTLSQPFLNLPVHTSTCIYLVIVLPQNKGSRPLITRCPVAFFFLIKSSVT